jgi:hypothetical protein
MCLETPQPNLPCKTASSDDQRGNGNPGQPGLSPALPALSTLT